MAQSISIGKQDFAFLDKITAFLLIKQILSKNGGIMSMILRYSPARDALEKP